MNSKYIINFELLIRFPPTSYHAKTLNFLAIAKLGSRDWQIIL